MEAVAASVEEHCGRWLSFERPSGGFYLWVRLKKGLPSALVNMSHRHLPLVIAHCTSLSPVVTAAVASCGGGTSLRVCWAGCVRGARAAAALRLYYRCECRARAATETLCHGRCNSERR